MIYDSRRLEYIRKTIGKTLIIKRKESQFYKFDVVYEQRICMIYLSMKKAISFTQEIAFRYLYFVNIIVFS